METEQSKAEDKSGAEEVGAPPLPSGVPIGPATVDEIDGLIELLYLRPPTWWIRTIRRDRLITFLRHAIQSERVVILLARPSGEVVPAGYVFAIFDVRRFWLEFALSHPLMSAEIALIRVRRRRELRRKHEGAVAAGAVDPSLPVFEWSPSDPKFARIIGLYVRSEHRRKGIAMDLYFRLFDALAARGLKLVEEYMGPDYPQYAGKFPEVCGWQLQQCRCTGYKISKVL